jgi:hypothetical protein
MIIDQTKIDAIVFQGSDPTFIRVESGSFEMGAFQVTGYGKGKDVHLPGDQPWISFKPAEIPRMVRNGMCVRLIISNT